MPHWERHIQSSSEYDRGKTVVQPGSPPGGRCKRFFPRAIQQIGVSASPPRPCAARETGLSPALHRVQFGGTDGGGTDRCDASQERGHLSWVLKDEQKFTQFRRRDAFERKAGISGNGRRQDGWKGVGGRCGWYLGPVGSAQRLLEVGMGTDLRTLGQIKRGHLWIL